MSGRRGTPPARGERRARAGGAQRGTAGAPEGKGGAPGGKAGAPPGSRGGAAPAAPAAPATSRRLAIDVLVRVEEGAYANLVLPAALGRSHLAPSERALATELVYGTTRMRRACDWLVDAHLHRPVVDPAVRAALRLGAYQLAFTRVPRHAAVSATVEEVSGPARGLVNAVLRRVADGLPPAWPELATELSYPSWVVSRLEADLGKERARAALVRMNEPPPVTARADGYVQDAGSQWVAALVGAGPGERVADLCAAPGGKATLLASGARPPAPGPAPPEAPGPA
ncbi:MAG: transcription antitermination factor NusB, partial [Acidimicrobiales bacterium]